MAPIKFEEQLKDKLEKRSLQPSTDSWAKLSQRLDTEEKKSKSAWFWWMGIAAGLIIMLAVVVQTFGSKNAEEISPKLVEEPVENIKEEQILNYNNTKATELASENNIEETNSNQKEDITNLQIINYKAVNQKKKHTRLATKNIIEEPDSKTAINFNEEQNSIAKQAIIDKDAVDQSIKSLATDNASVTDKEVDSLLKLASKELFKDRLQKESINTTVDAESLLDDVEEEMGQSFRSKVYEVLKDGYKTVKTAVVQRNN
ncbi:hypothetical protein [Winogradskyella sp.]|jgi:hypothetical protein|uniref:hypothetical protein n=1 Tax=Winogradskyella sp. TaxID=1883156 RepID=UPI0025E7D3C3|nr:hypothetical protein [Winogradskyella sp.]MCT4628922.1 hypothetical protein [Winogradskyella sp.]